MVEQRVRTVRDDRTHRLRARTVDTDSVAVRVSAHAMAAGSPAYLVRHGGGVANSYGYPAETECVVAVGLPNGNVAVWASQTSANKVTLAGAARAAVGPVAGDLWDGRTGTNRQEKASRELRQMAEEAFSDDETRSKGVQ